MRNRHLFLNDVCALAFLPLIATMLRFEGGVVPPELRGALIWYSVLALAARLALAFAFGLYRCLWPHASFSEMQRILYAGFSSAVVTGFLGAVALTASGLSSTRLPYITLALDAILTIGVLAAPRILVRVAGARRRSAGDRRALVVGAGAAGQMILRETRLNERLQLEIVGFVDDDPYKQKHLLGGVPVVGTLDEMPELIQRYAASELVIAMPNARGAVVRKVVRAATAAGISARIMPALEALISGRVRINALRNVEIEDLLRRESIVTDLNAVRELAAGRTVLITGAGGSIGGELCRQIAALEPAMLVVVDHSENQIFEIHGELRRRYPSLRLSAVIADIRDRERIRGVIGRYEPHAIFHAAAHKHVPLMEENIVEAITNNLLGTRNVVEAALDAGTSHLVNISTDKAVRPTSIMGATKRIAEQLVSHAATTEHRNFVSVRFGNVLGSRGSVIPTFLRQIKEGGPVTITHPEMRRFFMTIPEAVQLVLQAGALGQGGELFVLDMGEPVKIVDLARDLIRLSGLEEGVDIEIEYSGIRPGEKLYEEVLFGGEDVKPTGHPKVLRAVGDTAPADIMPMVDELIRLALTHRAPDAELRDLIRGIVPEYEQHVARTEPRQARTSGPMLVINDSQYAALRSARK